MNLMARKLMIVDDHAISRHMVRQVAATPQDTVLECVSPAEAMKALGTFQPDCVMMGVSLPPPGAFPAIRHISKIYPQVRVVAVSNLPGKELRQAANAAGASGFVSMENLSELFLLAAPERLSVMPARRRKSRRHAR